MSAHVYYYWKFLALAYRKDLTMRIYYNERASNELNRMEQKQWAH